METEDRPTPEEVLDELHREEAKQSKGHLKIFLGMAAGVGKTYTMLEEAQQLKQAGHDVVIGIVDTHGRPETKQLLKGLPTIPEKIIPYKGREFHELDLDAVLQRQPEIVLVDELAHSNVPGMRHAKRWQDIIEILNNGIDVYTTLNVQHIESLKDVIEGIAQIPIRETIPDMIIEAASSIHLVDLSPDELLQRLKDGKVYLGDQSRIASLNFFQKDRLTALREIVLRYVAEKVDKDLHEILKKTEKISGWKPREKLLVGVSPSPLTQKLIRTARRLAFNLDAPWLAVYVNVGAHLSNDEVNQLNKNLSLARDLGAEVITTDDTDIASGIARIARQRAVTQIIIGRPPHRPLLDFFFSFKLLDRLTKQCENIDVHVIRQPHSLREQRRKKQLFQWRDPFVNYLLVFFHVCFLSVACGLALPLVGYKVIGFIFLLGIVSLTLFFRKGPVFFGAILYGLIWNFIFIPESGTHFNEDTALFGLYLITAIITGYIVDRFRSQREILLKREETFQALYRISRQITTSPTIPEMIASVTQRLQSVIKGKFEIIIKEIDNGLRFEDTLTLLTDEKEKNAAIWVFDNNQEAGWSTDTLPSSQNLFIPLKGFHEMVGVLVYHPQTDTTLTIEEKNFLYTVTQQVATFLEKVFSEERERQAKALDQEEKIYQTVLKSISYELESPVSNMQNAILEAVKGLAIQPQVKEKSIERQIKKIETSSADVVRIFDSVSSMARLTSEALSLDKQLHHIEEVIETCYNKLRRFLQNRECKKSIEANLPMLYFDFNLIEILLRNLLFNAIDYSPDGSLIIIEAGREADLVVVSVLDEGPGIPPEMLEAIFEKFYRVPGSTTTSRVGLGLTIAKKIAEMHNGFLKAENREPCGAKFSLYLRISDEKKG